MSGRIKDLTGRKVGKLKILGINEEKTNESKARKKRGEIKNSQIFWTCECECGNVIVVSTSHLTNNHTTSCGCLKNKSLIGKRFGNLLVIEEDIDREKLDVENSKQKRKYYKCLCDCGNIKTISHGNLISGSTVSCGCKIGRFIDYTGYKFGRWTVLGLDESSNERRWLCQCSCGTIKSFSSNYIKNNSSLSCGCYSSEVTANRNKENIKQNEYEEYDTYYKGWDTKHKNFFLISKEDYEFVKQYCWSIHDGYWNANPKNGNKRLLKLHQEIMRRIDNTYSPNFNLIPDHININPSDNRRENLRLIDRQENSKNRHRQSNNTSGKNGVSFNKNKNKWTAYIGVNKKQIFLGDFVNFEDAVNARLKAEEKYGYKGE